MPYGLTGATQACQRSLDNIVKYCKDCIMWTIVSYSQMTWPYTSKTSQESSVDCQKLASLYVPKVLFWEKQPHPIWDFTIRLME